MRLTQFERGHVLQKGHVKLYAGEDVKSTVVRKEERFVSVNSKTTIVVPASDPRTDDQIRSDWKVEQERKLRGLRD